MTHRSIGTLCGLVAGLALAHSLLLVSFASAGGSDAPAIQLLQRGWVAIGERAPVSNDDPAWVPISLRHDWSGAGEAPSLHRWYRIDLELPDAVAAPYGLLISTVSMNAVVEWNGSPLESAGRMRPPITHNRYRPLYFSVPGPLVKPGRNELRVHVVAVPNLDAWLGAIEFGPDALLGPRFANQLYWRESIPQIDTALGIFCILLMMAFWLGTRESVYLWTALHNSAYVVQTLNLHMQDLLLAPMVWERVVHLSAHLAAIFGIFQVHRLLNIERRWLERLVLGWGALQCVIVFSISDELLLSSIGPFAPPSLVMGGYILTMFTRYRRRLPRFQLFLWLALLCGLLANIIYMIVTRNSITEIGSWAIVGGPLVFLTTGVILTDRFIRTLRRAEHYNEELEERVAEKHSELEEQFSRLQSLERESVLAGERERMMLEMHDGLGGRLVETLSMVESGEADPEHVTAGIRSSLDEMRLLLDSLDPQANDLPTLLAMVRERHEAGLARQGVRIDWQVGDIATPENFGPREALHVLRVVQEALTNVVKHAQAQRVTIRARPHRLRDRDGVEISIEDDGRGIDASLPTGRGLGNMHRRTALLGGQLSIRSEGGGTQLVLWLPA